jgi:hypothetical protein
VSKAPATSGTSAEIIILPKQLRMEWTDAMALDQRLSHSAFRVACAIGYHFGSRTGGTFVKHETIARVLGISPRTVWSAIAELEAAGYLVVKRRELGTVTRATRSGPVQVRAAGAKGVANSYLPALDSSQLAATYTGAKLAARCELWWSQRSQNSASKVATSCEPTLTSPSGKNPYARGRAREGALPGASDTAPAALWITTGDPRWQQLAERHAAEHGRRPRAYVSRNQPDGLPGCSFPADWIDQHPAAPTATRRGEAGSPPRGREGGGSKVEDPKGSDRRGSDPHLFDEFGERFSGTANG